MFDPTYLVVYPLDGGDIHVVGGGAHIFMLLVGEDVDTNQVDLQRGNHTDVRRLNKVSERVQVKDEVQESSTRLEHDGSQTRSSSS